MSDKKVGKADSGSALGGDQADHTLDQAGLTLGQTVSVLEELYPLTYAESWDQPGLIVGDLRWKVRTIYCAVDPTYEVIQDALMHRADLLITHHPLFFQAVHTVGGQGFRGDLVRMLIEAHCGLWVGHTNVDVAVRGQGQAFVEKLGLIDQGPLEPVDDPEATSLIGLGRLGRLKETESLESFAHRVASCLPETEVGITVAGDKDMPVNLVAVLPGSGDSLIGKAVESGADVYVTSDLRHHPVIDACQQARYAARLSGQDSFPRPAFINTPHSAIEKLWLSVYGIHDIPDALACKLGEENRPDMILTKLVTDPWTWRI